MGLKSQCSVATVLNILSTESLHLARVCILYRCTEVMHSVVVHPACGHSGECSKNARKRVVEVEAEVGGISRAIM